MANSPDQLLDFPRRAPVAGGLSIYRTRLYKNGFGRTSYDSGFGNVFS